LDSDDTDWTLDVEHILIQQGAGSLYDLDRTDVASLIPYFFHLAEKASESGTPEAAPKPQRKYADQADWL
jgi:hypothetical protein